MKKLKIATIVFLSGAALCLCAFLVLALSRGGVWNGTGGNGNDKVYANGSGAGGYSLVLEKEIPSADIHSLNIDYGMTFNDIYLYPTEGDSVIVREYMNFTPKESQISQAEEKGGTLLVKGVKRNQFGLFFVRTWDAYTEIYLPASLAENLKEITIKTLSGEITSNLPLKAQGKFQASSTSGDLSFPEIQAGKMQVSSTSGDLSLGEVQTEKIDLSATSGDIAVTQLEGDVKAASTSGNVMLDFLQGDGNITTTSGNITLGKTEGNMELFSTSGTIRLQDGKGDFHAETTSGDIRVETLEGNFEIEATSGSVSLKNGTGKGEVETISGDAQLSMADQTGDITVSTTSGRVEISIGNLAGDIDASTTSGDVALQLPKTASLTLEFDSASGTCKTFFDDSLHFNKRGNQADGQYGNGDYEIQVSTTSGSLRITEN